MAGIDAAFLIRRATSELDMARNATSPESAAIHWQLARTYQSRLAALNADAAKSRETSS